MVHFLHVSHTTSQCSMRRSSCRAVSGVSLVASCTLSPLLQINHCCMLALYVSLNTIPRSIRRLQLPTFLGLHPDCLRMVSSSKSCLSTNASAATGLVVWLVTSQMLCCSRVMPLLISSPWFVKFSHILPLYYMFSHVVLHLLLLLLLPDEGRARPRQPRACRSPQQQQQCHRAGSHNFHNALRQHWRLPHSPADAQRWSHLRQCTRHQPCRRNQRWQQHNCWRAITIDQPRQHSTLQQRRLRQQQQQHPPQQQQQEQEADRRAGPRAAAVRYNVS
jgi:hypothetical protein